MRLLIVDDHEGIRRGIQALLSDRADLEVCAHAVNGLDAVEKAKQLHPDVVLMDVSMPSMDGIEATRLIRQELPKSEVIIVSQNDPAIVSAQAKEVGAAAFVGKANLAQDLIATIDKVVRSRSERKSQPSLQAKENPALNWIKGAGEMATLMRSTNWSKTPLGHADSWSPTLRTMVNVLLASRFPQLLWWGPEFCCLYNDAYIPVLGTKHPSAIGRPVAHVWHEIWDVLKPLIETPFRGGPATWAEDIELVINRRGYEEETHFTVAYSPVPDDAVASGIGGVLATVHEITEKVIGERRIAALRELGVESAEPGSDEEACRRAAKILAEHAKDVPFVMLYLMNTTGDGAFLAASAGVDPTDPHFPSFETLSRESHSWPVSVMIESEKTQLLADISEQFTTPPKSAWDEPVKAAGIVPIRSNVAHQLAGFMIVGLSPRSRFDESYQNFLELMSTQIATTIANARAYEEERKRAEALAEIDRAKTTFFSNVSHEFRTPLTLMLGPVQDLLSRSQTHLTPTAAEQLEIVNRNGARLLRLVNTLLDFSRIEAGRVTAVYQATDLAAFTSDLAGMFRSATERAGLQLEVDCPPMNGVAYVDHDMWEKIVLNLISNAFKFTFDGKISVDIKQVGQSAELRVSDTGVGIPSEELPKLFDRFHRVPNARSRTHEGSGIGLSLVNELVKLHGGSIQVQSKMDGGTTFIVTVPLGQDHLAAEQIGGERSLSSTATGASPFLEEALRWLPDIDRSNIEELPLESELLPSQSAAGTTSKNRVLIADDNADMRQYLVRLLSGQYEVTAVPDGQSALESIREELPDLVLSDVMMPNLDGFGLLQALRSDSATNTVPLILLSARAGEDSRVEGLKAGADDYLVKPFSARELLARVQSHLELARVRKDADKRIRENEGRLRAFVTASSDVVYRMSPDWTHMYFLQGKDFISDTNDTSSGWVDKYIHPDDQAHVLAAIREAVRKKAIFELEHRVLQADGTTGWVFSRAIPVLDEQGEIAEWFGTASDVTKRKTIEEELRQSRTNLEVRVKQRTEELERAQSELRDLSAKLLQLQDEDRRRIASELHDSAGQTLTVLSLNLAELESLAGAVDSQFAEKMAQVHELVQRVTQEIRTTSYLLHPPLLDENGLTAALGWYVEGLSKRTSLQIDLSISQKFGRLPKEMELAIFRIVQECLTNILRHSGSPKAKITLDRDDFIVSVAVQDFGKGISDEKLAAINDVGAGVGVRGMKQRVRHLNGKMEIASSQSGTTISVTLPVSAAFTAADQNRLKALASSPPGALSQLN